MTKARELAELGAVYDSGALSNRNLIINGAMQVAQRGTSALTSGTAYPVDRFFLTNGTAGTFSIQYSTTSPSNFGQSIALTITGTDASPDATDFSSIRYKVEHNDMRHLYWGYSTASTVTLSFYVRSSVTGTHGGAIRNDSVNKAYPFSYTIDTADTWERKTITIPGETAGSWGSGANTGLEINWCIGAGSSRLGTAGAWNSNNNVGATGQVNLYATNSSTFYLTGVQLEVGESATPFEHRSYGDELLRCQRYYEKVGMWGSTNHAYAMPCYRTRTYYLGFQVQYKVEKRTTPSVTMYAHDETTTGVLTNIGNATDLAIQYGPTGNPSGVYRTQHATNPAAGGDTNNAYGVKLIADAEL